MLSNTICPPQLVTTQDRCFGKYLGNIIIKGAIACSSVEACVDGLKQNDKFQWFAIATGGSSDEDKFYPLLIRLRSVEDGLVVNSFLDMSVTNRGDAASIFLTLLTVSWRKIL